MDCARLSSATTKARPRIYRFDRVNIKKKKKKIARGIKISRYDVKSRVARKVL